MSQFRLMQQLLVLSRTMNDFSTQIKTMVGSLAHGAAALGDM